MDPISIALMGASALSSLGGISSAKANTKNQERAMQAALSAILQNKAQGMGSATANRLDRFGNVVSFNPATGGFETHYTPLQQRLIDQGQERQQRTNLRGGQASEDYNRLRSEYLYRTPPSEASIYNDLVRLITQSRGEGDRALETLAGRARTRMAGNVPTIEFGGQSEESPGQRLANTMLQARQAALQEYGTRQQQRAAQYLPALKQFESTANTVEPLDPTGSEAQGMQQSAFDNYLKALLGFGQQQNQVYSTGAGATSAAANNEQRAMAALTDSLMKGANLLKPTPEKAVKGQVGPTKGGTYSADSSGSGIGSWDRRYNFGPLTKGVGGEAAPFGGAPRYSGIIEPDPDPFALRFPQFKGTGEGGYTIF